MEIAVAVDHTLISFHGRDKVEQYVLSLMNIVSIESLIFIQRDLSNIMNIREKNLYASTYNFKKIISAVAAFKIQ